MYIRDTEDFQQSVYGLERMSYTLSVILTSFGKCKNTRQSQKDTLLTVFFLLLVCLCKTQGFFKFQIFEVKTSLGAHTGEFVSYDTLKSSRDTPKSSRDTPKPSGCFLLTQLDHVHSIPKTVQKPRFVHFCLSFSLDTGDNLSPETMI
jgi:hypothetical protein